MNLRLATLSFALFAVGCAAPEAASEQASKPSEASATGVATASIVEADVAKGKLTIAVRRDSQKITFDLRLGAKMELPPSPTELAADPDLTTYQIDALVLDADAVPFHMQAGGDAFLDPTWRMPKVENVNPEQRAKDYQLARDARSVLKSLAVPAGLEELRRGALQIALGLDNVAEKPGAATPTAVAEEPSPTGKATLHNGGTSVRYWDYYVAKKNIQFTWGAANHSAVTLRGWTGSYGLLFSAASCNHGTCSTSMDKHCTMSGFRTDDGTRTRYFYSESSTSTGSVNGGCATGYAWNSACGEHNCNDDSQVQGESIYYDRSYDTRNGHCSACGARYQAPNPPGC